MKRFSEGSESSASGGGGNGTGLGFTEGKGLSWLPEQATVQPHRLTDVIHGITQQQWRISLYEISLLVVFIDSSICCFVMCLF
jgi:DNA repair protein RadA/Sms